MNTSMQGLTNGQTTPSTKVQSLNNSQKALDRCELCNLSFTSQTVLNAHLQGSKHAKQLKSRTIITSLRSATDSTYIFDQSTQTWRCNICSINLNSIQQLQTHLKGVKHVKRSKGEDPSAGQTSTSGMKKEVVKKQPKPILMLECTPCNKFFNSQSQLQVHLSSKKHLMSGKSNYSKSNNQRYKPYVGSNNSYIQNTSYQPDKSQPGYSNSSYGTSTNSQSYLNYSNYQSQSDMYRVAPIHSNFVSSGYQNY